MAAPRLVVLLTDFGLSDSFVGIVKGVLSRAKRATVVDLCHEIPPQDVPAAALALRMSVPYFPKASLFVIVVDPGVGSKRRILLARSRNHQFLVPDNGVLSWLPKGEEIVEWRSVTNEKYFLTPASTTFQGRDIFAPVAASLCNGVPPAKLGLRVDDPVRLPWPSPKRTSTSLEGCILSFDRFGNALTNLPSSELSARARLVHRGRDLGPVRTHYAEVAPGRPLAVAGSAGFVEISTRDGDYQARSRARRGDTVHVRNRR